MKRLGHIYGAYMNQESQEKLSLYLSNAPPKNSQNWSCSGIRENNNLSILYFLFQTIALVCFFGMFPSQNPIFYN